MSTHYLLLCLSPDFGGLEQHVRDYARWLARQPGVRLSLALREHSRLHRSLADLDAQFLFLAPRVRQLPLKSAWTLARWITAHRPQVIHTHWRKDLPVVALAKLFSKPVVSLVHTQHLLLAAKPKRDPYHRFLYGALSGFIGVTAKLAEQALRWLPLSPNRVRHVHPGVAPLPPAEHHRSGVFTVGILGRLVQAKGQHLLLEAARVLRERGQTLRVVTAGDAEQPHYLESLKAFAVQHDLDVEFRGFCEPAVAYTGLDALAMCSEEETFGLVTVEAMRRGLPVVAAASGGTLEILRDGVDGLLFEPGNARDLAEKLERLIREPETRRALAVAARERAATEFDAGTQFRRAFETVVGFSASLR